MNNIYEISYIYTSNDIYKTKYNCVDTVRASSKERALQLVDRYKRKNSCENFSVKFICTDNNTDNVVIMHNVNLIK